MIYLIRALNTLYLYNISALPHIYHFVYNISLAYSKIANSSGEILRILPTMRIDKRRIHLSKIAKYYK